MTFRTSISRLSLAACLALLAVPALAQDRTPTRGYVMGVGGAAVSEVRAPVFGGGVGVNVTPRLQITGDFGRMNDLFPSFTREDLKAFEQSASDDGLLLATKSRIPTYYAVGGVRAILHDRAAVRPYVSANAGVARLAPEPTFLLEGIDVSSAVLQDAVFNTAFENRTRPLVSVGGGVVVLAAKHFMVDAGYRFTRIFIDKEYLQDTESPHQHAGINVNRFYLGVGFVF